MLSLVNRLPVRTAREWFHLLFARAFKAYSEACCGPNSQDSVDTLEFPRAYRLNQVTLTDEIDREQAAIGPASGANLPLRSLNIDIF